MKKLALALLIATSVYGAEVLRKEELPSSRIEKVLFDDHTYIHFRGICAEDSAFFHDPSCECGTLTQKRIKDVREIMRIWEKEREEE